MFTTSTRATSPIAIAITMRGPSGNGLSERYGSLDAINEAWGTTFWSQTYTDLDQVVPPRMTAAVANPALELDYKRFCSDAFLEEFLEERAILKAARPELPLTTNFMGLYKPLDYFRWAAHVDVVSTDNYTDPATPEWQMRSAMDYDLVRGLNKKVPWMVMEQAPTRVNWRPHNVPKGPGSHARHELSSDSPRRIRCPVLPMAGFTSRGGDVPLRHGLPRRHSLAGLERGNCAGQGARGARGPHERPGRGQGRDRALLAQLVGGRIARPSRPATSL